MFKRIAQKFLPGNPRYFDKISIEYGEILSQGDYESILFFMHPNLKWGGDLNRAVLAMAGPGLDEHMLTHVLTPQSGEVFAMPSFNTPYKALFMAILPDWDGGNGFEERDMLNCYRRTLELAQAQGIRTVAMPAMGRDKRDFPHIRFARLALKGILDRLDKNIDRVRIFCIDHTMMTTYAGQLEKMKRRMGQK